MTEPKVIKRPHPSELADFNTYRISGFEKHGGRQFSVPLFSQIEGNLWTGGCPVGAAPEQFDFIVCLYPWERYGVGDHQSLLIARLHDVADIPDPRMLHALADYVNAVRVIGPTLVHCQAGLNRSNLVAALALIKSGMTPAAAIALIRQRRCDVVLCNSAFEQWLLTQ